MTPHHILLIGLGRIGRIILKRLSPEYRLTCVDADKEALAAAHAIRGDRCRVVTGDATSRLVLEDAGVEEADTVVVTMTTERLTLEVVRLLHAHFACRRVIAVGITPSGIAQMEQWGAEIENIFAAGSVGLLNLIDNKTRAACGIGLGKNEIREVEIHPQSKLVGKQLHELDSQRWRVGLIYRDGTIVVPTGDTTLQSRDRVVVMGEPAVLDSISDILTFRFHSFPLEYGDCLFVYLSGDDAAAVLDEAVYLQRSYALRSITAVLTPALAYREQELRARATAAGVTDIRWDIAQPHALTQTLQAHPESYGLIVLPAAICQRHIVSWRHPLSTRRLIRELTHACRAPVIIARGTFPYREAAAACVKGVDVTHVMEHVCEMSAVLDNRITALLVKPSAYIQDDEDVALLAHTRRHVQSLSNVYRLRVAIRELEGNPITAIAHELQPYNLLLVDSSGIPTIPLLGEQLHPDVVWRIIRSSPVSTLILPEVEESF